MKEPLVIPDPVLAERTTLRLGGTALAEVVISAPEELEALPGLLSRLGGAPVVLGWGSNLLARDGDLELVLVRAGLESGPEVVSSTHAVSVVRAGAFVRLPRLLGWASGLGLAGLEGLTGIPGTLGGAVAMNAGSYGQTFLERVKRLRVWTPEQGLRWVGPEGFEFGYRHFGLLGGEAFFLVVEAELVLHQSDRESVRGVMRANYDRKRATQPVLEATAGCVFRNPPDESAGRLLDRAGFRGHALGGMAFSELHANFLVNRGGGTSEEALELLRHARNEVKAQFDVDLELEVEVIG